MIKKHPINPQRARKIAGSFAFIEQKFLAQRLFCNSYPPRTVALCISGIGGRSQWTVLLQLR